ncbi:hypothetical protein [Bacillus piscicola]|uniref:hypothetical protein n=1 Tax=Bacillus piscicola TaxID=1632684 RepID=UPI001F09DE9E|nr:hypothetical protein [Bacillus piscicola]
MLPDLDALKQRVKEAAERQPKQPPMPEPFVPRAFALACLQRSRIVQDAYKRYEQLYEQMAEVPAYKSQKLDEAGEYLQLARLCTDIDTRHKAGMLSAMHKALTDEEFTVTSARLRFRVLHLYFRAEADEADYTPTELTKEEKAEVKRLREDDAYFAEQYKKYKEELANE